MRFTYLGWHGHQNLGDDAIHLVLRDALHPAEFTTFPTGLPAAFRAWARPGAELRDHRVLLGGGTVIGRANWRLPLMAALRSSKGGAPVMIGAGVEDPSFRGRHSFSGFGELRRWRRALAQFARVTVRGPRSAELLSDIGVEATVVGDPALLLAPARPAPGDCVVVCLGFGDDLWGHDHTAVEREVGGAIARLRTAGLRVRFVAVNPEDVPAAASAAAHAGETGCEVHVAATPAEFFSLLDGAAVVVAERLHAAVLAACAGVPFVSLEYQPKCADFAGAVAASARVVRTDRVRAGELAELVIETADDEDSTRRVYAAVEDLRTRLRGEINAIIGAPDCDRLLA